MSLGGFRFEYEYEIEDENDFSVLDLRLQIVTSHTRLIGWATLSTQNQREELGLWKLHWFEIWKSHPYSISHS